jgi:hypothetical protein
MLWLAPRVANEISGSNREIRKATKCVKKTKEFLESPRIGKKPTKVGTDKIIFGLNGGYFENLIK